ncbi:CoA-binding protein [Rhizobium paknamense]|uniref:CoA-binding protein n=1 Tax=Rhizobium paknamense TaxID=1206817 RepID=A0ABU0I8V7_9HYPH|nr:CoA-binding protein [Rhizobium paknamense]MDQ0454043.1 putative CoA-binding protein [Rhizobium paknamense]
MNHDAYDNGFLRQILSRVHTIAVVGASLRDDRPSHWVTGFLLGKGYRVFPVNPAAAGRHILGQPVYESLAAVPEPIDLVDVFRKADAFSGVVDEVLALPHRPLAIWGQLGVRDDAAAARAEAAGIAIVMNRALVAEYRLVYEAQHPAAHHGTEQFTQPAS